jgi:hypothetical protein
VAVFVFGHTHAAFLKRLGSEGRVILNTGTWLKLLHRVPVRFGFLPAVYYPSYRLNYFCIEEERDDLVINYVMIPKSADHELTWLQRLLTLGKAPKLLQTIPARTVLKCNTSMADCSAAQPGGAQPKSSADAQRLAGSVDAGIA